MPKTESHTSFQQLHNAYDQVFQAARILLQMDSSILFGLDRTTLKAITWSGCDAANLEIAVSDELIEKFLRRLSAPICLQEEDQTFQVFQVALEGMRWSTTLFVSLLANEHLLGLWLIAMNTGHPFGEQERLIFQTLAEIINLKTSKEFLTAENLRYLDEAKALYEISMEISQYLDLDRVLETVVEKTCSLLHAEVSYIGLADEKEKVIRVRVTHGARGEELIKVTHKFGEGVGGWVAENRKPLIVDNYYRDVEPQPPGIPEILATEGIISAICVPMCTHRGLVGVLYATSRREAAFSTSNLQLLQALGNHAAIAIENARLYAEQKQSAEKLRNSITNHERLLSLVMGNEGIQAITDTLSELVQCPIIVENDQFQILSWSSIGYLGSDQNQIMDRLRLSKELWNDPASTEWLKLVRDVKRSIHISLSPSFGENLSRFVTPIVRGNTLLGYISAIEVGQSLNEQQRAAVEEASIIFALEILKQEAARASLLQHIITAQEDERKRIARELHDETSQGLTALMVSLDSVSLDLIDNPKVAAERLRVTQSIADSMLENIHRLTSDLRPSLLDDLGLFSAITWYSDQRLRPLGIQFNLESNLLNQRLSPAMEIALYRIVQEAFTNIIRHAQASRVTARLNLEDGHLILEVEDDGRGFDPQILSSSDSPVSSMGLLGMQERVSILKGEFHVKTAPGKGTIITVRVPLRRD